MNSEEWLLIQQLFHEMSKLPESEWEKILNKKTQCPLKIKRKVLELLTTTKKTVPNIENIQHHVSELFSEINLPKIDDYEILERIAIGGMGSVYKAWDKRLSRYVAIKFLHPHHSQHTKYKQRFLREARSSAKLRHENICPTFEVSQTTDEKLYIVSAFCEGVNLSQKIRSNSLTLEQILSIFEQLLSALETAHAQGIVHRDLKPENIIIDKNYKIQLVDFGIAKNHDNYQTMTGEVLGTPDYMPPEQFRGEAFDHLSDIWSCGIILYEMIEGKTPYFSKTAPEIIYLMLHEPLPLVETNDESLAPLYSIIRQCLQTDKNFRPANVDNLQTMLIQARASLYDKNALDSTPTYKKTHNNTKHQTLNTLSTQREIVSLYLKLVGKVTDETILKKLELSCLKYRGIINITSTANLTAKTLAGKQPFLISAFFGYPVTDELKIKNAISCGQEWESILTASSLEYFMLSGFETLIEHQKTFITDPILKNQKWLIGNLIKQVDKSGFWITDKLAKSIRGSLVNIQATEIFSNENSKVTCHSIKTNLSTEIKENPSKKSEFIGRDSQLSFLLENWEQAIEGDQQRILISGEAGIGKSRIIYEFKKHIKRHSQLNLIELDCSSYEKASTYYPILQYIHQQISASTTDRNTILQYLDDHIETSKTEKYLLFNLLGIRLTLEEQINLPTGDLLNRQYQDLLLKILTVKPEYLTTVLIIEDLHWADTATGIIIEKLLHPSSSQRTLILMSSRPEYKPAWLSNIVTSNLYLSRLRKTHSEALLKSLLKKANPSATLLIPQLVDKTGGNPLFIEEMAKTVSRQTSSSSNTELSIPETIQDTLVVRLEKLGAAQYLAQVASIIGRDFKLELLRECYDEPEIDFNEQLQVLIRADIIRSIDHNNNYQFKHALIRDAAYQMLIPKTRHTYHRVVALSLEKHFEEIVLAQPELIAQHWEAALNTEKAIDYWLHAAKSNLQLSVISECLLQIEHIIKLTQSFDNQKTTDKYLLKAYLIQGPALMIKHGYADEKVNQSYLEAIRLCENSSKNKYKFSALFGLWTYHCVRANHKAATDLAQQMVDLCTNLTELEQCEAHMVKGITKYYRGDFISAQNEFLLASSFYNEQLAQQHILLFGQDPKVVILSYQSWNESVLGNIELAIKQNNAAVTYAESLNHPFTLTYALSFSTWFNLNTGQLDTAQLHINESIEICENNNIAVFLGLSKSLLALIQFSKNEVELGTETIQEGEKIYLATGAALFIPSFLLAKAEIALAMNDFKNAEKLINQSIGMIDVTSEKWCLAPALLLKSVVSTYNKELDIAAELQQQASKLLRHQQADGLQMVLSSKGLINTKMDM